MKKNLKSRLLYCAVSLFVICLVMAPSADSKPLTYENTTACVGKGFGDQWNKYAWSMADFNGHMYVGTSNVHYALFDALNDPQFLMCLAMLPPGNNPLQLLACMCPRANPQIPFDYCYQGNNGAAIWRYDYCTEMWERVYKEDPYTGGGFRKMMVYNNRLYASTASGGIGGIGAHLIVTKNGVDWTAVPNPPEMTPTFSFRALAVYADLLYVGTDAGEIWSYDGVNWQFITVLAGGGSFGGILELAVFNNLLYAGTPGPIGFAVYAIDAANAVTDVTPPAILDGVDLTTLQNIGTAKLYAYKDKLLMGTANFYDGFTFLAYDGVMWEIISIDGLGNERNTYVWSIEEFEKIAYMATFNSDFLGDASIGDLGDIDLSEIDPSLLINFVSAKPEMFYSTDGLSWEQIPLPSLLEGWGIWNYGIRNMEAGGEKLCGGEKLFLGTASNLFAPDAKELIELIIALIASGQIPLNEMPTYIDASLLLSTDAIPPEELLAFIDFILVQLIGPGTQVWAAETVDMLPPPECSTSICPLFATVYPGDEVQFSTTGDGDCNMFQVSTGDDGSCKDPCYTWEISLMGSTGSTIDSNGLYTAGGRMGVDIVTVTDECNGGSSASAAIIIQPPTTTTTIPPACTVTIDPAFETVYTWDKVQFSATSDGNCNTPCYTWEIPVMGSTGSTIDTSGLYTAGGSKGTDIVTVTDQCNWGISASAVINVETHIATIGGYCKDFLEDGNPGGWTKSLQTYDEEWTLDVGEEVNVDIWLNDLPELLLTGGFLLEYDPSTISIMSVEVYDGINGPPGPWDPGFTNTQQVEPGIVFLACATFDLVEPGPGGDIIIAKVRIRREAPGETLITVSTIPDFDTVVSENGVVYDLSIVPNAITINQVTLPEKCYGDFDFDSDVDGADAKAFKDSFGRSSLQSPCSEEDPCKGDFDCDADCDGTDADTFKKDFGRSLLKDPCPITAAGVSCSY